ncbi:hypothetical protein A2706_02120 [Candidatus Peribacteria bacterium RIFCSPHIGHO2_01_FULL_51_35]|nr:MAG: hypothetical protein A2706_02120 [Candidatus Peribacteria bacterium RIFCSPHIGHO2_01_FULL_51_35]
MHALLSLIGSLISVAHAQVLQNVGTANPGVASMWATVCSTVPFCSVGTGAPALLFLKISGFLLMMIGGVAVAALIYAGIKIILSRGQDEGMSEGKKIAMYALLGLVLAIIADALVLYVVQLVNVAAS